MSQLEIIKYAEKMTDAINCLRNEGYHVPALILMFITIDHFAWASILGDKSTPKDFQEWVTKYMLSKNPIGCSAEELWASRNGLVHMGTAESAAHANGTVKNKIYYTLGNTACTENKSQDVVFVNVEDIIESFLTGLLWFISDLKTDTVKLNNTVGKLGRMLSHTNL